MRFVRPLTPACMELVASLPLLCFNVRRLHPGSSFHAKDPFLTHDNISVSIIGQGTASELQSKTRSAAIGG